MKDVFIIYSKSINEQYDFAEEIKQKLIEREISIWSYEDWEWNRERRHIRTIYNMSPKSSVVIDEETLDQILSGSRIILYVEDKYESQGVSIELNSIPNLLKWRSFENGSPIFIRVQIGEKNIKYRDDIPWSISYAYRRSIDKKEKIHKDVSCGVFLSKGIHMLLNGFNPFIGGHYLICRAAEESPQINQIFLNVDKNQYCTNTDNIDIAKALWAQEFLRDLLEHSSTNDISNYASLIVLTSETLIENFNSWWKKYVDNGEKLIRTTQSTAEWSKALRILIDVVNENIDSTWDAFYKAFYTAINDPKCDKLYNIAGYRRGIVSVIKKE